MASASTSAYAPSSTLPRAFPARCNHVRRAGSARLQGHVKLHLQVHCQNRRALSHGNSRAALATGQGSTGCSAAAVADLHRQPLDACE